MPLRTPGSDPSSSSRLQSTPALQQSRPRGPHASSSSSPSTDTIQTPRDEVKLEGAGRGRKTKGKGRETARRSVRVRESSAGASSPGMFPQEIVIDSPEMEIASVYHPQTQPDFAAVPISRSLTAPLPRSRSRAALPPRPTSKPSNTLALAQAHGITPFQFEEAKQQVMRFLKTDSSAAAPYYPADEPKPKSKPSLARSVSFAASTPRQASSPGPTSQHDSYALTATPVKGRPHSSPVSGAYSAPLGDVVLASNASANTSVTPSNPSIRVIQGRASLDDFTEGDKQGDKKRREEDARKERDMQLWVEEGQGESSSDDETIALQQQHQETIAAQQQASSSRTPRASHKADPLPRSSSTPRLNSPRLNPPSEASPDQLNAPSQPGSLAKRGMMERFMSDRVGSKDEEAATPRLSNAAAEFSPNDSSSHRPSKGTPNPMMTSPVHSSRQPSQLMSPDVARLLRSELNELEANGSSTQRSSPRKRVHSTTDILADEGYSSPYQPLYGNRPHSASPQKRHPAEIVSSVDIDALKRARRGDYVRDEQQRSPTPSTTSLSLRAPSFCDSSPPMSERDSNNPGSLRPSDLLSGAGHPTPATDYLYHGFQSSSPMSASASSSQSDYDPRGHNSSPGSAPLPSSRPSATTPKPATIMDASLSRKRAPLKRAETCPSMGSTSHLKPSWSYAALIGQAIFSTECQKISLADIYTFIMSSYPYYKKHDSGWQNSIRHNLSLNECFIKTARTKENPGKGCLWAIAPGCEDQFADGGFTKKGAVGSGRRTKPANPSSRQGTSELPRSSSKRSAREEFSDGESPEPHPSLSRSSLPPEQRHPDEQEMEPSRIAAAPSPIPSRPSSIISPRRSRTLLEGIEREQAIASETSAHEEPLSQKKIKPEGGIALAPAYVHRESMAQTSPAFSLSRRSEHITRRHALTSPATASPPTSVYHHLNGPYQPMMDFQAPPSAQSHRALALLASPEAGGIMPARSFPYESSEEEHPSDGPPHQNSHFLPAPHIFPGSGRSARQRNLSDDRPLSSKTDHLSSDGQPHTRSPISSMRGSPRPPLSPLLEKPNPVFTADPEKKRASGLRHLPAVSALADASETFRSPPRHHRSPSNRTTHILHASMSTPGGRRSWATPGRPGASPTADGTWGWGDPFGGQLEAELERFGADGDVILGSGTTSATPRLYWPSPSGPSSHVPW